MKYIRITILSLLFLAFGVVVSGCIKKQQPAVNFNQPVNTNTSTTTAEIDTTNWKTYRNEEYGFEIRYPSDWTYREWTDAVKNDSNSMVGQVISVTFGPASSDKNTSGYIWSLGWNHRPSDMGYLIDGEGNQFTDKKITRRDVIVSGVRGTEVITKTSQYPDWVMRMVFLNLNGMLIVIKNGATDEFQGFDQFYNSFNIRNVK